MPPSHAGHQGTAAGVQLIHVFAETWGPQERRSDRNGFLGPIFPTEVGPQRPLGQSLPLTSGCRSGGLPGGRGPRTPHLPPLCPLSRVLGSVVTLHWIPRGPQGGPYPSGPHRNTQSWTTPPREEHELLLHKHSRETGHSWPLTGYSWLPGTRVQVGSKFWFWLLSAGAAWPRELQAPSCHSG